jgi:hypothetical protein
VPLDDISPISNYPRVEEPTISAEHSAAFLALQFWQSVVLVMFTGFGIFAVTAASLTMDDQKVFWGRVIGVICIISWLMSIKHLKRLGRVLGWKPTTKIGAYLVQAMGLLACFGAIGPWVIQYYAAKSITRYRVNVWWPFLSNSKVLAAIAPDHK